MTARAADATLRAANIVCLMDRRRTPYGRDKLPQHLASSIMDMAPQNSMDGHVHRAPTAIAGLTPAWLAAVLGEKLRGAGVGSVEIVDVAYGTATKIRLRVAYEGDAAHLPTSLIVKGGFADHRVAMSPLYAHEVRFYRDLQSRLGVPSPLCLATQDDFAAPQHLAVLEDLVPRGVTFCQVATPLTYRQASDFLDILARLHASFWNHPALAVGGELGDLAHWVPLPPPEGIGLFANQQLEPATWAHYMALPRCQGIPRLFHDMPRMRAGLHALNAFSLQGPVCLLHADFHLGNLYLEADGKGGVLDWQSYSKGHWSHDVTYFLVSALDPVDRRRWEGALVAHYLDRLRAEGVDDPPALDDAMVAFRIQIIDGLFFWMVNPPEWQKEENNCAVAPRFAIAALDHRTFDAF